MDQVFVCSGRLCETPKSPPGDYNALELFDVRRADAVCETPKSPPGDYNPYFDIDNGNIAEESRCETPKSPPGDYNRRFSSRMRRCGRKCETPKSPPGDYNLPRTATVPPVGAPRSCETPKSPPGDYNPFGTRRGHVAAWEKGVKHLNPRQGITTLPETRRRKRLRSRTCETPKSPPGDYNQVSVCTNPARCTKSV